MVFVERKCWILIFKVEYTALQGRTPCILSYVWSLSIAKDRLCPKYFILCGLFLQRETTAFYNKSRQPETLVELEEGCNFLPEKSLESNIMVYHKKVPDYASSNDIMNF